MTTKYEARRVMSDNSEDFQWIWAVVQPVKSANGWDGYIEIERFGSEYAARHHAFIYNEFGIQKAKELAA